MTKTTLALLAVLPFTGTAQDYPTPPEAERQANVPTGTLNQHVFAGSKIFPGTTRDYWVYTPAQYDPNKPAALMVFQDGRGYCSDNRGSRAHIVFDNLIHAGDIPTTVGLFIQPGVVPAPHDNAEARYNRSFEYDGLGDAYARFLIDEMIPRLKSEHGLNISDNPDDRAICTNSAPAGRLPMMSRSMASPSGSWADTTNATCPPSTILRSSIASITGAAFPLLPGCSTRTLNVSAV
ncbi:MAG: alpha/beta hydrolase-fold protein, partial [Verrucomicrobiales bacterium]|nr:alpha/beta hydrolase-fold protein [Verrucomicrobiales bacterium]